LGTLSSDSRSTILGIWHDDGEEHIFKSAIPHIFIRATGFMTNFFGQATVIKEKSYFTQGMGNGKVTFLDPRDLGESISAVLAARDITDYSGKVLTIVGPKSESCFDVARDFSTVLNKVVQYVDMPQERVLEGMLLSGTPEVLAKGLITLGELFAAGIANVYDRSIENLIHKKGHSFSQFIRQNQNAFKWI